MYKTSLPLLISFIPVIGGAANQSKPNVLMIIVDDLRPELGCYGVDAIQTPVMDSLAGESLMFRNAFCNTPVSGASRASMLTGLYPKLPERFSHAFTYAQEDAPEAIPMPQWFKDHGYHTVSNGKVFHNIDDHASAWSEDPWRVNMEGYESHWAVYNKWELWMSDVSARTIHPKTMRGPFYESADLPDSAYQDGKVALKTISDLRRLKESGDPFFLACGFWRPHLPFNAPKKYWDLYNREEIPLIIHVPGTNSGETLSLVELVDLYPTLCDLTGIPQPQDQLQGRSFAPVFNDARFKTKDALFVQWGKGDNAINTRYSYAKWMKDGVVEAEMLFDHKIDPDENHNMVKSSVYKPMKNYLSGMIDYLRSRL